MISRAAAISLILGPPAALGADDTDPPSLEEAGDDDAGTDCHRSDDKIECSGPPSEEILITEIMQNPSMVWDSLGEWFEIHNAGSQPVDLGGWTITDDPDIVIIDDFSFELPAERNGFGDGRDYTITYEITTPCGGTERFTTSF